MIKKTDNMPIVKIIILLCIIINLQCKKDVCKLLFPLGSYLTKEIIVNASQIIEYHNDIILVYKLTDINGYSDYFILFYNDELKLVGIKYFAPMVINEIKNDTIYGFLIDSHINREKRYNNRMSDKYTVEYLSAPKNSYVWTNYDKIVDKIVLKPDSLMLCIRKKDVKWNGTHTIDPLRYNSIDTINFPNYDLVFSYDDRNISKRTFDLENGLRWDQMAIIDKLVLENFYDQLWEKLKSTHER